MTRAGALLGVIMVVVIAGCSSGGAEDMELSFESTFDWNTQVGEWAFTGEAVDEGIVCPAASGAPAGIEDTDGNPMTFDEVGAMINDKEEFTAVFVDELDCVDGSGGMTMRHSNAYALAGDDLAMTATWEIVGTGGHEGLTGEGEHGPENFEDDKLTGSGTGVARSG